MKERLVSRMFLVASLPKSGTQFMTKLFQNLGVNVFHEKYLNFTGDEDGVVSGIHADRFEGYEPIIHQVRHPLSWLNTHVRDGHQYWIPEYFIGGPLGGFIHDSVPPGPLTGEIMLLMIWLRGHEYIERAMRPVCRFRVEDMRPNPIVLERDWPIVERYEHHVALVMNKAWDYGYRSCI
jgi:hypothetical protein